MASSCTIRPSLKWIAREAYAKSSIRLGTSLDSGGRTEDPGVGAGNLSLVFPAAKDVNLRRPRVPIDNPHLGHADLGVEGELLVGLVGGTADLDDRGRRTLEVIVAIHVEVVGRQEHQVGDAIVAGPAARRGDVDLVVHPVSLRLGPVGS